MKNEDSISRSEINQIAWQVRDDEADPAEVRRLLENIRCLIDNREPLPPEVLRYVRDSLRVFLDDPAKTLDQAFGIKKGRGRPKADASIRIAMAVEVLRLRLAGSSHRDALDDVGDRFCKSESVISDAWAAHRPDALITLRLERDLEKFPWSEEEMQRLEEIFEKEQRFLKEQGYLAPDK